jgi:hypothetical protein
MMVLRVKKSLKLAEFVVSLYPHQAAQAQHQLLTPSTVYTLLLTCYGECQRRPLSVARSFHVKRSSPQTAGGSNLTSNTIRNPFMMHSRSQSLFPVRPDMLNPLSIVNSTLRNIQSQTSTHFPSLNTLELSQTFSLNNPHLLCHGRIHATVLVLH